MKRVGDPNGKITNIYVFSTAGALGKMMKIYGQDSSIKAYNACGIFVFLSKNKVEYICSKCILIWYLEKRIRRLKQHGHTLVNKTEWRFMRTNHRGIRTGPDKGSKHT